LTKLWTIFSH